MAESDSQSRASADTAVEPADQAERLLIRGQQGKSLDVDTFLESSGQLSAAQLAALLGLERIGGEWSI